MPERPSKGTRQVGASVRQRLLNLAKARGEPLDLLLTRYTLERLLHRLSLSPHRDRFVLKGAMLLTTWFDEPHRATRDLDLLGFGDPADDALLAVFREVMAISVDDGLSFNLDALSIAPIREDNDYGGSRLCTTANVAGARVTVVIDIGFGDAVEPAADLIDLPVLLDLPAPRLRAYPRETVVAEKLHAMVVLGLANSRMKDYFDLWMLLATFEFDPLHLQQAVHATFKRRGTPVPDHVPVGLSEAFSADPRKQQQWSAFVRNLSKEAPRLVDVVTSLRGRLSDLFGPNPR
jgi:predicted nucleotidyltransferase component of viral defense system